MLEFSRIVITDKISRRYDCRHFIVLFSLITLLGLYILLAVKFKPSFIIMLLSALALSGFLLFAIMRNPLNILTLRMQKRLGVKEIIFDAAGFTVITLRGELCIFEGGQAEIFSIDQGEVQDHYLQVKRSDGKSYSFYVGTNYNEVKALNQALEQNAAQIKSTTQMQSAAQTEK